MINEAVGVKTRRGDDDAVEIVAGRRGHALYGPYVSAEPGDYVAQFNLEAPEESGASRLCAMVDVVSDKGTHMHAHAPVYSSQIAGSHAFELPFRLDRSVEDLEMRVYVNGSAQLVARDTCKFRKTSGSGEGPQAPPPPNKFRAEHPGDVDSLFLNGFGLRVAGGELIVDHSGVSVHARIFDDVRFLGEIFLNRVYNLVPPGPSVLIDVGMNLGVVSMLMAQDANFEEIHAFEPFPTTYARALDNLALNPSAAARIEAYNFGLSDREETLSGFFNPADSGMSSTQSAGDGDRSATVSIRDASQVLAPIFARAEAAGRRIVMKVDCEGSEFPIFRSLEGSGLMAKVSAMMVEWHRGFGDRDRELFAPLRRNGFLLIDRDPPEGNGFFYAVRAA